MKLVASLVCKNELSRYLRLCIDHLLEFCDGVAVLDDGSTDGTYEWLLRKQKVAVLTNGGPSFYQDESRVRNALLAWTLAQDPTYVLAIDADEFVEDGKEIRDLCYRDYPVMSLDMQEVWRADLDNLEIRLDGSWGNRSCPILWQVPSRLDATWKIPAKKLACGREPMAVRRTTPTPTGLSIYHFGWARQAEREARYRRYAEHDQGRFHRNAHLESIMWPDEKVQTVRRSWPSSLHPLRESLAYQ